MSHVIIETPTFDTPITVPDALDPGTLRAEDVEDITQRLANRSQALKAVTDVAAVKNASNTFTAAQTINANLNVSGVLHANGGIGAADGTVEVVDTLVVNADAYFNEAHLYLDADVDIVYPSPGGPTDQPQRLVQVDISRGCIAEGDLQYNPVGGFWLNTPGAGIGRLEIPIIIPRETLQWSFQVIWAADSVGEANSLAVYRWDRDYSVVGAQAPASGVSLGTLNQTSFDATAGNAFAESGPVITETNHPADSRYGVVITFGDGTNNRLYGLRLQFWDPGARNG